MGGSFWPYLSNFARETMLNEGVISPEDLDLIHNVACLLYTSDAADDASSV